MSDPAVTWLVGDVRAKLCGLADNSVHCVVTSPPYWRLRAYGTEPQWWGEQRPCPHARLTEIDGHVLGGGVGKSTLGSGSGGSPISPEFKEKSQRTQGFEGSPSHLCLDCGAWRGELGQEPDPDMFVAHLAEVFAEVHRVLRPDGVCFVNMDDTYTAQRSYQVPSSKAGEVGNTAGMSIPPGLKAKELALVPARLSLALQKAGWWVRCDVVWEKPDAMPESMTDRPTRSHEYLFMLTKSQVYFWDQEAVKVGLADGRDWTLPGGWRMARNIRSVWRMTTDNFPEAHFAVMSKSVAETAITGGTSEKGCCADCGAPVVRTVERRSVSRYELPRDHPEYRPSRYEGAKSHAVSGQGPGDGQRYSFVRTTGWEPSCSCGAETIPCVVLDPFGGAATTGVVGRRLGRSVILIELGEQFVEMAQRRMETWWKDVTPTRGRNDSQMSLLDGVGVGD